MKSKLTWLLVVAFTLTMAGLAFAQSGTTTPPEVNPPSSTPGIGTGAENKGLDKAVAKAADPAKPELEAIRTRAKTLSAKEIEETEPKIATSIKSLDAEAAKEGSKVPDRLAKQLGTTSDLLAAEKVKYGTGFGGLMVAHMILSSNKSASSLSLDDLFKMHQEGMGWGQIAHGLGLKVGELVSAAHSQGGIAAGTGNVEARTPRIGSVNDQGPVAAKAAAGTAASAKEYGKSGKAPTPSVPNAEKGKGSAAGHGK